ncbi:MAG TPA: GDP-L-fucose synthase [Skermanella sp.]|nr:GDP-L-fucose synthase [Skermanella sp.]
MRELFDFTGRRVWVAGHAGMVGSAVVRRLTREGCEILTVGRKDLDLRRQSMVEDWMEANRPDAVVLAAGRVGGIVANSSLPGDFLYDNLAIAANVIHAARGCGVTRLLYLGSSCIYPKLAEQPMTEGALLTGPLEPSNEWYAVAKIAGVKLCQAYRLQHGCDFISAMPTNLYGPGDNFDPVNSHVVPGLMARIDRALAEGADGVRIWGSGTPRRDFLHVDDLADAAVFLLRHYSGDLPVNIGTGQDVSVLELAELLAEVIGWRGRFDFDPSKPDGAPRKVLDIAVLEALGWTAGTPLRDGLAATYRWYRQAGAGNVRGGAQVSR